MKRMALVTLLSLCFVMPVNSFALSNTARVPVLYYHPGVASSCDYANYASMAFAQDLELLYQQNPPIHVIPLYWLAEWALGQRDGSTLPDRVVAISTDDGPNDVWIDVDAGGAPCGGNRISFKRRIEEFRASHPELNLQWWEPHVSNFVIASPKVRQLMSGGPNAPQFWTDDWWAAANQSGFMEIHNHSIDHDMLEVTERTTDPVIGVDLVAAGYGTTGDWVGHGNWNKIDNYLSSQVEISYAASYINLKIAPAWPDLFAYPFYGPCGRFECSPGQTAVIDYLQNFQNEHGLLAAFTTKPEYVSRGSNRWMMGRFGWQADWTSSSGLQSILNGATW